MFSDHHVYRENELNELEVERRKAGADFLVTTEKDVARLDPGIKAHASFLEKAPLYYVEIEQSILRGESVLNELLGRC